MSDQLADIMGSPPGPDVSPCSLSGHIAFPSVSACASETFGSDETWTCYPMLSSLCQIDSVHAVRYATDQRQISRRYAGVPDRDSLRTCESTSRTVGGDTVPLSSRGRTSKRGTDRRLSMPKKTSMIKGPILPSIEPSCVRIDWIGQQCMARA